MREPTQPHEYIPFDILWAAWSWSSACFPALWIYYKDTKENNFIWGRKNTGLDGCEGGGGEDKNGWGRPRYYQSLLFISSFLGSRIEKRRKSESRTHLYHFVPRLAAVTVVTSSYQTTGNSVHPHSALAHSRRCADAANSHRMETIAFDHMSMRRCTRYLCKHFI